MEALGSSLTTESCSLGHSGKAGVGVGLGQVRVCPEQFGDKGPACDGRCGGFGYKRHFVQPKLCPILLG